MLNVLLTMDTQRTLAFSFPTSLLNALKQRFSKSVSLITSFLKPL